MLPLHPHETQACKTKQHARSNGPLLFPVRGLILLIRIIVSLQPCLLLHECSPTKCRRWLGPLTIYQWYYHMQMQAQPLADPSCVRKFHVKISFQNPSTTSTADATSSPPTRNRSLPTQPTSPHRQGPIIILASATFPIRRSFIFLHATETACWV